MHGRRPAERAADLCLGGSNVALEADRPEMQLKARFGAPVWRLGGAAAASGLVDRDIDAPNGKGNARLHETAAQLADDTRNLLGGVSAAAVE